jgi:Flp pilus assembly protein TadG
MMRLRTRFSKCSRGTTTVEFALVAPAIFLLMTGTLFAGLLVYSAMGMQSAVEKAARCYSVNATQCTSASTTQTYAQTNYFGVSTPTFTASTPACGHQVAGSLTFNVGWSIPLTATACFP